MQSVAPAGEKAGDAVPGGPAAQAADERFMQLALAQARQAAAEGEVPVGAVVVGGGPVKAPPPNPPHNHKKTHPHPPNQAIAEACAVRGGWQLWDCELYVTMEPCPMCAGAIVNSRIRRVVWGAADARAGCCGSVIDLFTLPFNHRPQSVGGVCADECAALLQGFFTDLRGRLRSRPRWRPSTQEETP